MGAFFGYTFLFFSVLWVLTFLFSAVGNGAFVLVAYVAVAMLGAGLTIHHGQTEDQLKRMEKKLDQLLEEKTTELK